MRASYLKAPIRKRRDDKNTEINPVEIETFFEREYGPDIEDDYLVNFGVMIGKIEAWGRDNVNENDESMTFKCSILHCVLRIKNKELWIRDISTRPCAQGKGFYRYYLWRLRNCVVGYMMLGLYVSQALTFNEELLQRMGFTRIDPKSRLLHYWKPFHELADMNSDDWSVPRIFPSAAWLNSEEHVNGASGA